MYRILQSANVKKKKNSKYDFVNQKYFCAYGKEKKTTRVFSGRNLTNNL